MRFRLERRNVIGTALLAAAAQQRQPAVAEQFGSLSGYAPRVEGIGGGADVLSEAPSILDVAFPPSLIGLWQCERCVVSCEGDASQAAGAWFDLGGRSAALFTSREPEIFLTRFVASPSGAETDGGVATVLDRSFEVSNRISNAINVTWDVTSPNTLLFERGDGSGGGLGPTELTVVQRKVELPSDKGFGFDELIRVSSRAGGLFGDQQLIRAARVKRRYRRAYDENGERVVEGLEVMKTYRVLDGVAGVELPTSTTKSTLRLTRPRI